MSRRTQSQNELSTTRQPHTNFYPTSSNHSRSSSGSDSVTTNLIQLPEWDFESAPVQNPQGDLPWFDIDNFDAFPELGEAQHSFLDLQPEASEHASDSRVITQFSEGEAINIEIDPKMLIDAPAPLSESQPLSNSLYQSMQLK